MASEAQSDSGNGGGSASDRTLRCPMCGGTEFDLPRRVVPYSAGVPLVYLLNGDRAYPSAPDCYTRIRGRACLSCGYVFLVVDTDKLRHKIARLDPNRPRFGPFIDE